MQCSLSCRGRRSRGRSTRLRTTTKCSVFPRSVKLAKEIEESAVSAVVGSRMLSHPKTSSRDCSGSEGTDTVPWRRTLTCARRLESLRGERTRLRLRPCPLRTHCAWRFSRNVREDADFWRAECLCNGHGVSHLCAARRCHEHGVSYGEAYAGDRRVERRCRRLGHGVSLSPRLADWGMPVYCVLPENAGYKLEVRSVVAKATTSAVVEFVRQKEESASDGVFRHGVPPDSRRRTQ